MQKFGCPERFIQMVRQLHDGMMARVTDNGAVSEASAVTNGVKQGCVLAPTLLSLMFSAMLMDAYRDKRPPGIRIAYRTDGQLLNQRRMHFQSRVSTTTVHELLFSDDCALNTTSEEEMQRSMDLFSAAAAAANQREKNPTASDGELPVPTHLESSCSATEHEAEDVQGRHPADFIVRSGDLDSVHKAGTPTEPLRSQLSSSHPACDAAIYEANRVAAAATVVKVKREARNSQLRPLRNADAQTLPTRPRCKWTLGARIGHIGHFRINCTSRTAPTVVPPPASSPSSPLSANSDCSSEPPFSSSYSSTSSSSSTAPTTEAVAAVAHNFTTHIPDTTTDITPATPGLQRGEVTTVKEPPPVTTALRRLDLSTLGQQIANLSPLLLSDPSTATAATKAATVGGGGRVSSDASAQSSGVGVGANTPLRVNMLNDLIRQMVSLKRTPSSSVSLVGAGNMTATDDGPNNAGVIGSSSRTGSRPTQSAGERKQLELTITSALTRAQRLLDNDAARKALGGTYIYQTDWLSSKPKSDMPFAHVHVDLMGPLSTSPGCNYLLTAVDRFARWSFATPIPNVAADTVPRAFLQHWISHCAVPTTITID
ncbi:hypothetical protein SprV_0301366700 [Sparganum proliferum]